MIYGNGNGDGWGGSLCPDDLTGDGNTFVEVSITRLTATGGGTGSPNCHVQWCGDGLCFWHDSGDG